MVRANGPGEAVGACWVPCPRYEALTLLKAGEWSDPCRSDRSPHTLSPFSTVLTSAGTALLIVERIIGDLQIAAN